MGAVFRATHVGTMRTVALKVIVPALAGQEQFLQRFKREAEASGRLRHPNVVNVTDFGVTHAGAGEVAYMVMEYLDGQTLSGYLRQEPRPSLNFIFDIVEQTALALDAARAAGIVHRDLKPSNIWLEPDCRGGYNVKVLDFGIAKVTDRFTAPSRPPTAGGDQEETIVMMRETMAMAVEDAKAASLISTPSALETTVGTLLGTPAYMAPEQCQGLEVDYRADIYSLATITYEMLCSRLPFQADDFTQLIDMQLHEPPKPPHERDNSIPEGSVRHRRGRIGQRPGRAPAFRHRVRRPSPLDGGRRTHSHPPRQRRRAGADQSSLPPALRGDGTHPARPRPHMVRHSPRLPGETRPSRRFAGRPGSGLSRRHCLWLPGVQSRLLVHPR